MVPPEIKVSVAEVCEVRGYGLNAPELLSLAVSAADRLPPCPKGTAFDADHVFISSKGTVEIKAISSTSVSAEFIPPEWSKGEEDPQAAAVYCLGAVLRAAGAEEASDVDLFSLVNILTVAMTGTRPTAHRMGQMARNQLRGRDPASMLMCVYEEIMGDEDENQLDDGDMLDLDDDFLSTDGSQMRDDLRSNVVVKQATEFYEDDNNTRGGASTSTSSGNSTQKETSPFGFFDDDMNGHKDQTSIIVDTKPRTPSPNLMSDSSFGAIGSPLSHSTRLNETYIEEKSIDWSGNRSSMFEDNFTDLLAGKPAEETHLPATIVQPPTPTQPTESSENRAPTNPFDDDDNDDFHGGTLSGRDPFDEDSGSANEKSDSSGKKAAALHKKKILAHRLSSSSEEIVEAHVPDEEEFFAPPARPVKKAETFYEEEIHASPPPHRYSAVVPEPGLTPLEEAQRALRANRARHRPSAVSTNSIPNPQTVAEESTSRTSSRQRFSAEVEVETRKQSSFEDSDDEAEEENVPTMRQVTKTPPQPIEAVVITEQRPPSVPISRKGQESDDEKQEDEEDIDAIFNQYKKPEVSKASVPTPVLIKESAPEIPPAADRVRASHEVPDSPFNRRNSLVASRVSRRSTRSMRGKRKTRAMPEFYDLTRHTSIRLRAPSAKKKKMTLHRVEETEVTVELLNGQKIEVGCRSDVVARDIFFLVVQHMNLNEHVFFGLSFLRDGEHYFIDENQRLEKFAPSGWKSSIRSGVKVTYMLHLRFRFYPQILDFIKTEMTMHELFLQCRRDVLEERIQPKRDAAFELAALALQAEFGNRPPPVIVDYFDMQHYIAKRFCSFEDPSRLKQILTELHGHYVGTRRDEAENKYIQICQRHGDFGCHLHRVFRSKPTSTHGASPFDPDTGSSLWIGIMPRGIRVYEEQGGLRELLAEHLWPQTQTLQFDKKRFVIVALGVTEQQVESTFYTDHHSKSSYFVKFAASQHRFMMKMRQWKSTLRHENTMQSMPDVCVEGRQIAPPPIRPSLEDSPPSSPVESSTMFPKMAPSSTPLSSNGTRPTSLPPPVPANRLYDVVDGFEEGDSQAENFERLRRDAEEDSTPRSMQFDVVLIKDPAVGLGLTLVDGNLNSVPGVYVKMVADNGAGMKAGLCIGDRITAIASTSLEGQDRLRAVELVRQCGDRVPLTIARVDGIIRQEKTVAQQQARKTSTGSNGLQPPGAQKGVSRTPPAPRRAANRRQRAVSDFGAIGDALPALDGDNLIDIKAISGLHLDESDEEKGEYRLPTTSMYAFDRDDEPLPSTREKPQDLRTAAASTDGHRKYRYARRSNLEWTEEIEEENGDESDDDDDARRIINVELERNENGSLGVQIASLGGRVCIKQLTAEPALSHPDIRVGDVLLYVNSVAVEGKSHQEVVSMLRGGGDVVVLGVQRPPPSSITNGTASNSGAEPQLISVILQKKPQSSLGLSLAKRTMTDGIFIRLIASDSAAATEGSLRVGDRLVSLDGEPVDGLTPSAILDRLKAVQGPVQITVSRGTSDK